MNRSEMHIAFRQYGQQMGMQNTRTILPEQIDLLLNTVISDTINSLIKANVGLTNNGGIIDNSKVSQINAFRTLYKVDEVSAVAPDTVKFFTFTALDKNSGKFSTTTNSSLLTEDNNVLYFVDFSISYRKASVGLECKRTYNGILIDEPVTWDNSGETTYFPVRLVDDTYLANNLHDYMLKPKFTSPILVIYGTEASNMKMELYIDKLSGNESIGYTLRNGFLPYKFRVSYIAKPDVIQEGVDCNLPEYMHFDIVKRAVDMYRIATAGALYNGNGQSSVPTSSTNNTQQ